jgi:hypothetical protein
VLVFIVWWTMFSGRSNHDAAEAEDEARGPRDEEPPPR